MISEWVALYRADTYFQKNKFMEKDSAPDVAKCNAYHNNDTANHVSLLIHIELEQSSSRAG